MKENPSRRIGKKIFSVLRLMPAANPALIWLSYTILHRRMPSATAPTFNDILYRVKSKELKDPLRCFVSDKHLVKFFVRAKVGDTHNIPTVAVVDDVVELVGRSFPCDVVIKPTHSTGHVIFLRRGQSLGDDQIKQIASWLRSSLYKNTGEENYRHLRKRVIVERMLHFKRISDYKLFCRNGKVLFVQVDQDRFAEHRRTYYDADWQRLPFTINAPPGETEPRPECFEQMKSVAQELSSDLSFVRVDLYAEGREIYVGEITNCHGSAHEIFRPHRGYDHLVGRYALDDTTDLPLGTYISMMVGRNHT